MFWNSGIQNSGIAYWNTASLENARFMFAESRLRPDVDLSKWNTQHCRDMSSMFRKTAVVDSGIGHWNTASLEDANHMFAESGLRPDVDLSKWNTQHCRDMSAMFYKTAIVDSGIGHWNVASLQDASLMFAHSAIGPKVDLSKWNTKNCRDMSAMFESTAIVDSGIGRWDVSSVVLMFNMLKGTSFSGNLDKWSAKQRLDALNGVLPSVGTRRTASWPTRFGKAEPLDGPFDPRSFFADLVRAKSVPREESAEGEERSSDACTLM